MRKKRSDGYLPHDPEAFRYLVRAWKWNWRYGGGRILGNVITLDKLRSFFRYGCHPGTWSEELEQSILSEQGRYAAFKKKRHERAAHRRERSQKLKESQRSFFF